MRLFCSFNNLMRILHAKQVIKPPVNFGQLEECLENSDLLFLRNKECLEICEVILVVIENPEDLEELLAEGSAHDCFHAPSVRELILCASTAKFLLGEECWEESIIISKDPYLESGDEIGIIQSGKGRGKVIYSEYLASGLKRIACDKQKVFAYVKYAAENSRIAA